MTRLAVSAVIPTYDRAELLPRAIRSALDALAPGDEVIVADDGSTDDTAALVNGFGEPVRLLGLPHRGAGAARNAGFAAARGPLVAFLDSDDEWLPDKIALQRSFLERRPDLVFCCSDFGVRLDDGAERHNFLPVWMGTDRPLRELFGPAVPYSSVATLPPGRADFAVHTGSMYLQEMRGSFIAAFTLMVRKADAGPSFRFAEDLPTCEEWPAFGHLTRQGPGALFDTETAWQNGHRGPRLTQLPRHVWAAAWLATLERVWGSDPDFLAEHGAEYRRVVSQAWLTRAFSLARHGRPGQALAALRHTSPAGFAGYRRGAAARRRGAAEAR